LLWTRPFHKFNVFAETLYKPGKKILGAETTINDGPNYVKIKIFRN
jgi:hypothetical protein